ncbi:MAG: amino acid ABC transporter ATP-binding protein [Treponemataceae bacterium]|nr:amino acid ABC transporter ATP-binding protein [Spirochaetales bacterium]MDY6030966.1 amino acid ABC transporter ATP-binding protein [Treponemataceae bacterium]
MEVISVKNINKTFKDGFRVLNDISFTLNKGEVLGIIGPSGSGKSTLLRSITQLTTVDEGTISICGQNLVTDGVYSDKKVCREIGLKVGLVFQNFNLFPHKNVLENITIAQMNVLKRSRQEAESIARELLAKMNLSEKESSYPCQLSGGQQQRVSIARALAMKPEVLFFDEPTSALDPELTGEILKVIRSLAEDHMTMVVVTHEMSFARDLSDKIIFMCDGSIVEQGSPKEVFDESQNERIKSFLSRF